MTTTPTDPFMALADPARRLILETLARGERPAGDFGIVLPHLSQPSVSRHLRVLRAAGLVVSRIAGAERRYALVPERLAAVTAFLIRLSAGAASPQGEVGSDDGPKGDTSSDRRSARRQSSSSKASGESPAVRPLRSPSRSSR